MHGLGGVSEDALGTKGKEEHETKISRDTLVDARCLGEFLILFSSCFTSKDNSLGVTM